MALLAILPVHAIYAGFDLRESLVALTSILAVWFLTEVWSARGCEASGHGLIAAGLAGGAAVLARNTAMATPRSGRAPMRLCRAPPQELGPMIVWGARRRRD